MSTVSDYAPKTKLPPMPRDFNTPIGEERIPHAQLAVLEKRLSTPLPSIERIAEMMVELKLREWITIADGLKTSQPNETMTPEAIILWLHAWAEKQLEK